MTSHYAPGRWHTIISKTAAMAALSPGISNPTLDNDFRAPHLLRFRAPAALQTSTARDHWYCLIDVKIQKVQLVEVKHQECLLNLEY